MHVDEIPPELSSLNAMDNFKSASLYEAKSVAIGSKSIGWPDHQFFC